MINWWSFLAANSYRLSVPTIYVQNSVSFTNSFSRIIFINSLSLIFFYKFNITNLFSRIRKSSKMTNTRLRFGSFSRNQCHVANGLYCIIILESILSVIHCSIFSFFNLAFFRHSLVPLELIYISPCIFHLILHHHNKIAA